MYVKAHISHTLGLKYPKDPGLGELGHRVRGICVCVIETVDTVAWSQSGPTFLESQF